MVTARIIGANNHAVRKSIVFLGTGLHSREAFNAVNTLWQKIWEISAKHENMFFNGKDTHLSISALLKNVISCVGPLKVSFEGEVGLAVYTSLTPELVILEFEKNLKLMKFDCMELLDSGKDFKGKNLSKEEKEDILNMDAICDELFSKDDHSLRFKQMIGRPFDPLLSTRMQVMNDRYKEAPDILKGEELRQALFDSWEMNENDN